MEARGKTHEAFRGLWPLIRTRERIARLGRFTSAKRLESGRRTQGRNATHIGFGTSTEVPVNVNRPVSSSMANTVTLFDAWPPARRNFPPGAIAKCRGVFARVGSTPRNSRVLVSPTIRNIAIESWPRVLA